MQLGGGILKNITGAGVPQGATPPQESFTKQGPVDPDLAKQKILKDKLLSGNEDPLHVLWCAEVGSGVTDTPMSSPDGKVIYLGGVKGKIYALAEDALEECLARKTAAGDREPDDVPTVELGDDFVMIGGIKLGVNKS